MPIFAYIHRSQIRPIFLKIAIVLFITSLLSPAVFDQEIVRLDKVCLAPRWAFGLEYLLFGAFGVLDGQFGWFANPLMLLAVFMRKPVGLIFAALSVALTIHTAFSLIHHVLWRDGGVDVVVCGFGPGYYLWVTCSVLVLVATLLKQPKAP